MTIDQCRNAEEDRLNLLETYQILDTDSERQFDEIVELASEIAGMPISLISLVDRNRQWFKSKIGLDVSETPLEESFCAHAIASDADNMVVKDATKDSRFMHNRLVTGDPGIRFYAGFPLITADGTKLGTLCIIDKKPNILSSGQIRLLQKLSNQAMKLIELHISNKQLQELRRKEEAQQKNLRALLSNQKKIMTILAHDTRGSLYSMKNILDLFIAGAVPEKDATSLYPVMHEQTLSTIEMIGGLVQWGETQYKISTDINHSICLRELVQEVFTQYNLAAGAKSILLENATDDTVIHINGEALKFAIRNLVSNAIKYTESGKVTISGVKKNKYYEILVSDTGIGMNKEKIASLFASKAESTSGTRNEKGSGLGFMLLLNTMGEMECDVKVKSKPNEGTTVRLIIPNVPYIRRK